MQLFEKTKRKPGINLTPLIDILFILIIFFVVSAKIIGESGVGLVLPESSQGKSTPITLSILSVDENQQIWLNDVLIEKDTLARELRNLQRMTPTGSLIFNVDKRVPHGTVISLMDDAKSAGFRKIVFGTRSPQ